jgi:hypothetical protein
VRRRNGGRGRGKCAVTATLRRAPVAQRNANRRHARPWGHAEHGDVRITGTRLALRVGIGNTDGDTHAHGAADAAPDHR